MSILEEHDKRCGRTPLTPDDVLTHIEAAERYLERADRTFAVETERVMCWLADRLQGAYAMLEDLTGVPKHHSCGYCFRQTDMTPEAFAALPRMSLDDVQQHAQVCDHNPLVQKNRALRADLEEARGRIPDETCDLIRALLESDMPAGELRRALADLVGSSRSEG